MKCLTEASRIRFNSKGIVEEYSERFNHSEIRTIVDGYINPDTKGYNLYFWN